MSIPVPTPIYRITHIRNLAVLLRRRVLHAPLHVPDDGLPYVTIHNIDIQRERHIRCVHCGPSGTLHDYVPFYFGPRSPMLLQLHTGKVSGYNEGQKPLIYLVSSAQTIAEAGRRFVFSDGHGIAAYTQWYDDLADLGNVDWEMVNARFWADDVDDNDRQRRKQAEFLIHEACPWEVIEEIGVIDDEMKTRVMSVLGSVSGVGRPLVKVRSEWYY